MTENETNLRQLQETFLQTRCIISPFYRIVENTKFYVDCDEIIPNLFVGNNSAAQNKVYLKMVGITHVVNMAEGEVDTGASFYQDQEIKYIGVTIDDIPGAKIEIHFQDVSKFINDGINGGGKVLVHCLMGFSRSASCAIAYLMIYKGMTTIEACQTIKSKHVCRPNDGFLQKLVELDNHLKYKIVLGENKS